jgi:hypothetical protein
MHPWYRIELRSALVDAATRRNVLQAIADALGKAYETVRRGLTIKPTVGNTGNPDRRRERDLLTDDDGSGVVE